MSKSNGAMFSKALFGYRKSDVNEYIRQADEAQSNEISRLKDEILKLENTATAAEIRIKDLEAALENERATSAAKFQKLTEETNKKLAEAQKKETAINDKLTESEARASSYLKLADSSSQRAEAAEAEVTRLTTALENAKLEIEELNTGKTSDAKRISELEKLVGEYVAKEAADKAERSKYFVIKRPSLMRFIRRK